MLSTASFLATAAAPPLASPSPSLSAEDATAAVSASAGSDWRVGLLLGGLAVIGALLYFWYFVSAATGRGRVRTERLGPPEAGVAAFLMTFILLFTALNFAAVFLIAQGKTPAPPTPSSAEIVSGVLKNSLVEILLVLGLLIGWAVRRIPIAETLGLVAPPLAPPPRWPALPVKLPPTLPRALASAFGLLLAAIPLVVGAGALVQLIPGISPSKSGAEEEAVRLFKASGDFAPRLVMILTAVVVAPLVEEFVFRGYIYPVLRKYLGATAGILLNSALFAAMHAHLPSLAPLFVLAVCLTLAYEATGTLLVPIAMHALFNTVSAAAIILGLGS